MTASPPAHGRPICPYLRAPEGWRGIAPSREHRCSAVTPPVRLAGEKQARLCLVEAHASCATYNAAVSARAAGGLAPDPDRRPIARTVATVTQPAPSRFSFRGGARRIEQGAVAVLMLAAVVAVAIARTGPDTDAGASALPTPTPVAPASVPAASSAEVSAAPSEPASAPPEPTPTANPTAEPTPVPTATPGPTPRPTPEPTPKPTPAPATFVNHVVKTGDTLYSISVFYGRTIASIKSANGMTGDTIYVGQVLKIPQ